MKMRILIMMILSILGINSNAMTGPENLTIAQGNQYIVGFFSTSVYVPANHTLEWSCSPWAIVQPNGTFCYVEFYNPGYYTVMARPYDNTTGAGVVADTMNVIVVSNFAFIIPTDIPSLMLSNEILLANKL